MEALWGIFYLGEAALPFLLLLINRLKACAGAKLLLMPGHNSLLRREGFATQYSMYSVNQFFGHQVGA